MSDPTVAPTEHRITSGETPTVGLRVFTNDWVWGTIVKVDDDETYRQKKCGTYCEAWHTVHLDGRPAGSSTIYNCDRLTTRKPK